MAAKRTTDDDIEMLGEQVQKITIDVPSPLDIIMYLAENKLTQKDVATKIGIDASTLSRWLSGDLRMTKTTKAKGTEKAEWTDTTYKIAIWWRSADRKIVSKPEKPVLPEKEPGYVYVAATFNAAQKKNICVIDFIDKDLRDILPMRSRHGEKIRVYAMAFFDDAKYICEKLQDKFKQHRRENSKVPVCWFNISVDAAAEGLFDLYETFD